MPSVSSQEFVENAIVITKTVNKKLKTANLAIFDAPPSEDIFFQETTRCYDDADDIMTNAFQKFKNNFFCIAI